jgi:hypothetical protein
VNEELRNHLLKEIESIAKEHTQEGWDGYDASPISQDAVKNVISLIMALPDNLLIADVGPDPDGSISLEWSNKTDTFVMNITNDGLLVYAGIYSTPREEICGEEKWNNVIPEAVLNKIKERFTISS